MLTYARHPPPAPHHRAPFYRGATQALLRRLGAIKALLRLQGSIKALTAGGEGSLLLTTEPLWAALFGWFLLGESVAAPQLGGGACIMAACLLNMLDTRKVEALGRSLLSLPAPDPAQIK